MITKTNKVALRGWVFVALLATLGNCRPDESDDAIPYVPFQDIPINMTLPEYASLRSVGAYKYIDGGVRGILLYRASEDALVAFERNCSFQPNNACATVEVDASGLQFRDNCCSSVFNTNGTPFSGPAWRPLRQYVVTGFSLEWVVTDEIE